MLFTTKTTLSPQPHKYMKTIKINVHIYINCTMYIYVTFLLLEVPYRGGLSYINTNVSQIMKKKFSTKTETQTSLKVVLLYSFVFTAEFILQS